MIFKVLCGLLLTLGTVTCQCDSGWTKLQNNCYLLNHTKLTWSDAMRSCKATNKKSNLADITSTEENKAVTSWLFSTKRVLESWTAGVHGNPPLWNTTNKPIDLSKFNSSLPASFPNDALILFSNYSSNSWKYVWEVEYYTTSFICKYKPPVQIICNQHEMSINIENEWVNNVNLSLVDQSCIFQNDGANSNYTTSYDMCGTKSYQDEKYIIYENVVKTYTTPGMIINRDPNHEIVIKCKLERSVNQSLVDKINVTSMDTINTTEAGFGSFLLNLRLFKDNSFTGTPYLNSDYPLSVRLRDNVNVELDLATSNSLVTLFPQGCYATPTDKPDDPQKYHILKNRCGEDSTYKLVHRSQQKFQFSFQAFTFLASNSIYLHCQVLVCQNSSSSPECMYGCHKYKRSYEIDDIEDHVQDNRVRRDLDDIVETSSLYTLTANKILLLVHPSDKAADESKTNGTDKQTLMVVLGCAFAVIAVIVISVAVVMVAKHRRKASKSTSNKSIGQKQCTYA